ncbi:MAG: hypothetical protein D6715_03335 [Calditrichaeota bacterium]|nr:MAG: hypothetical protein D6715_03335 [Calditrichota bacterium]
MAMIQKFRFTPRLVEREEQADKTPAASSGEEFFRVPRAEFLLENRAALNRHSLGELVVNAPHSTDRRFTLPVEDDTMRGAGLQRGDVAVVQPGKEYREGELLAICLGERVLIRRFFLNGKRVRLETDPPAGKTIIVELDTPGFQILGRVVQLLREI